MSRQSSVRPRFESPKVFMRNAFLINAGESKVPCCSFRQDLYDNGCVVDFFEFNCSWSEERVVEKVERAFDNVLPVGIPSPRWVTVLKVNHNNQLVISDTCVWCLIAFPNSTSTTAVAHAALYFCSDLGHHVSPFWVAGSNGKHCALTSINQLALHKCKNWFTFYLHVELIRSQ